MLPDSICKKWNLPLFKPNHTLYWMILQNCRSYLMSVFVLFVCLLVHFWVFRGISVELGRCGCTVTTGPPGHLIKWCPITCTAIVSKIVDFYSAVGFRVQGKLVGLFHSSGNQFHESGIGFEEQIQQGNRIGSDQLDRLKTNLVSLT